MHKFLTSYLPALSISFTFIVLYSAIINILHGYDKEGYCFFILQIIGYLAIAMLVDFLVSFINFKKFIYHFIVETLLLYPITIAFILYGKWFPLHFFNFIWYSSMYVIVMCILHYYFYYITNRQATEINNLLQHSEKE